MSLFSSLASLVRLFVSFPCSICSVFPNQICHESQSLNVRNVVEMCITEKNGPICSSPSRLLYRGGPLKLIQYSLCKVTRRRVTSNISRPNFPLLNHLVNRRSNSIRLSIQAQMSQHHCRTQQHGCRISLVLFSNVFGYMTTTWFV